MSTKLRSNLQRPSHCNQNPNNFTWPSTSSCILPYPSTSISYDLMLRRTCSRRPANRMMPTKRHIFPHPLKLPCSHENRIGGGSIHTHMLQGLSLFTAARAHLFALCAHYYHYHLAPGIPAHASSLWL